MACRFPGGASSPTAFWRCLTEARDLVTEIDESRWSKEYYYHPDPRTPGRSYTWSAGVLDDVDRFDADFFGISPREASEMDPQQRILLELVWEALEDGGQVPEGLAGSDCAVYVGISGTDYANRRLDDPGSGNAYVMTGGTLSIAANRISYVFDLHGPSMAVDTACSSSLVALHQACHSIRRGESATAIAGGVNLLMTPFNFIGFSKASMLSPSGRSRAFDAAADGYVRSEGGAVVFLKLLSQARRDGDPIHALILGSAVNSDGRTRGLSMPSTRAQAELLESAYRDAGVDPADLAYVEAHGTGTAAGDPREAGALGRVLAARREAGNPLPIGSVKTNLGHLEPASGMAGLLKAVLCLKHRAIPASLHFTTPNPDIPFGEMNLEVVSRYTELPASGQPALLGVNSFGFGGTNAHVVLGEHQRARPRSRRTAARRKRILLFLSARSPGALSDLADGYRRLLRDPEAPPAHDVAHNAALRRQWHDHRLAVVGGDAAELARRLEVFRTEGRGDGIVSGQALGRGTKLALVFSGNGSQWAGMGRRLLSQDRRFRRTVEAADVLIRDASGFSVIDELRAGPRESRLHLTERAQPALFALQVGLLESLIARGIEPEAVLGHSVGEVAAAHACGALDLEQAVRVIHERSQAQATTRGQGRMAALGLSPVEAIEAIESYGGEIELAAVNSPSAVTLSGPLTALQDLGNALEETGTFFRILDLDYAFHSRAMDPIRDGLLAALSGLCPGAARRCFVSSVTGKALAGEVLGPRYWWDNVRQPVRFDKALSTLVGDGFGLFLEVGPHPIMQGYLYDNLRAAKAPGRPLATLRRDADGVDRIWEALGSLYVHGARLDPSRLFKGRPRPVSLPAYPWQKEPHWYQSTDEVLGMLGERYDHPLLGYPVRNAAGEWRNHVDAERIPYLADHVVGGAVVFPATAFIEMAIAASRLRGDGSRHVIEDFEIRAPLLLMPGQEKTLRFKIDDEGDFTIESRPRLSGDAWVHHASGKLAGARAEAPSPRLDLEAGIAACPRRYRAEDHYRITEALGLGYGPAFRGVAEVCCNDDTGWARIVAGSACGNRDRYHLHPCQLDPCLQTLACIGAGAGAAGWGESTGFLPFRIGRLVFHASPGETCHCRAVITRKNARSLLANFTLVDGGGYTLVEIEDFRFRLMRLKREDGTGPAHYVFRTELRPRRDERNGEYLPRPTDVAEHLVPRITEQWFAQRRSDYYDQVLPLFDALTTAFVYRTFRRTLGSRSRFTLRSLLAALRADPSHVPFLQRLVLLLEEDGMVERDGSQWRLTGTSELTSPEEIWRLVLADFPVYLPESVIAGRAGLHLSGVLKGERDAAEILSPTKGAGTTEYLLDSSPTLRIGHYAACEALAAIIADWPAGRRIRILEIGAGAMGLSAELLSQATAERCDYVFTSPNPELRSRAETEFGQRRAFSVAEIDLTTAAPRQDLPPNHYDVVIASHALHEITDLDTALGVLRWLLVRDGLLLLLERPPERLGDLVFGLHPQWWVRSPAPERPRSRLLREEEWCGLLERRGFVEAVPLSEPAPSVDASSFLIVARNPEHHDVISDAALPEPKTWLVLAGEEGAAGVSGYLTDALRGEGHRVIVASAGEGFSRPQADAFVLSPILPEGFERLFAILADEGVRCDEIVHLMGLRLDQGESASGLETARIRCLSAMHLAPVAATGATPPRLWLVTCGAFPIDTASERRPHLPSQAALAGVGRVLANEHPELRCRIVDVPPEDAPAAARLVVAELHDPDTEDEVLAGAPARYGLRLERLEAVPAPTEAGEGEVAKERRTLRLDFAVPGPLANLRWYEEERRAPGRGEIEIKVRATGLNFRDVMYAMGMLSDEAVEKGFAGATLGMECSGDVVAVGPDVTGFRAGDPVVCFARACFGTFVTTETTAVAHKPAGWTYEEAASVPSVFFTVYYALDHLAALRRGDRILIHGAAGGVGMAAIQHARYLGAEIFATAGSPQKRDFLRLLGVEHVLDSRSLAFADEIMELTAGAGVDVVLNSLSGPAMRRSLDLLKPFGRFLELGKRDFYENAKVGLRPFRNNITYHGIDADQLLAERSDLAGSLFRRMMGLFEQGAFRPLVHRAFPARRITEAFRYMQQSAHIGKVVVTYEDVERITPTRRALARASPLVLDPDASYLVIGGLGGFGLATAAWLAEKGARQLVLVGRNGAATHEAREGVERLRAAGARVEICEADVCEHDALARVVQRIDRELPPLKGVVHAAMVLDDRLIARQDAESFDKAFGPKARGAWNLHVLTRDRTLDFFVLFSSVTTCFGNPGQANYVAGNNYLESLAQHRRALGLPAIAVGFGPIGDTGYLARNERLREALVTRTGGEALRARQALRELEGLMSNGHSGVAVATLDWQTLRRALPALRSRRFDRLGGPGGEGGERDDIRDLIAGLPESEAHERVTGLLTEQVAKVLRLPAERLDPETSIYNLGMDSLMAVELHMAVEEQFNIHVPVMVVTEGVSIAQLAGRIAGQLRGRGATTPAAPESDLIRRLASRHGESLDTEEIDRFIDGVNVPRQRQPYPS